MKINGFTLVELLIVISISLILAVSAVPIYGNLQVSAQLNESSAQAIQAIRNAREMSSSRHNGAQHGVYFDINENSKDKFILYQGSSYASRDADYDIETELDKALVVVNTSFDLTGTDIDINFSKGLAEPGNIGVLAFNHLVEGVRFIVVNEIGMVELE